MKLLYKTYIDLEHVLSIDIHNLLQFQILEDTPANVASQLATIAWNRYHAHTSLKYGIESEEYHESLRSIGYAKASYWVDSEEGVGVALYID